jgi:ATP-dependent protease Clp ATPase subunit
MGFFFFKSKTHMKKKKKKKKACDYDVKKAEMGIVFIF